MTSRTHFFCWGVTLAPETNCCSTICSLSRQDTKTLASWSASGCVIFTLATDLLTVRSLVMIP